MKRFSGGQKIMMLIIAVIAIIFVGGVFVGTNVYGRIYQIDKYLTVLKSGDAEQIAEVLTTEDPDFEITADTLQPFIALLEDNPTYINDLETPLKRKGEKDYFSIVQNGKTMFFFDKYDLVMEPVYIELHTNLEGTALLVNGKEETVSDHEDYSVVVGPYAPGLFEVVATTTINGFELRNEDTLVLVRDKDRDEAFAELPLEGKYFEISSNVSEWNVVIDGKNIGKVDEAGKGSFGPISWEEGMEVQLEKEYLSGIIATEPQPFIEDQEQFRFEYNHNINYRMTSLLVFDLYFNIINHFHNAENVEARADEELKGLLVEGADNPLYKEVHELVAENKLDKEAYEIRYTHTPIALEQTDVDAFNVGLKITEKRYYPRRSDKESFENPQSYVANIIITNRNEAGEPTAMKLVSIEPGTIE